MNYEMEKLVDDRQIVNRVAELLEIKARTEGRRISRRQLAKEVGLSLPTLQSWIDNDIKQMPVESLNRWCAYFKCDIGDLLLFQSKPQSMLDIEEENTKTPLAIPA